MNHPSSHTYSISQLYGAALTSFHEEMRAGRGKEASRSGEDELHQQMREYGCASTVLSRHGAISR
jgi:hypothetical protein